MKLKQYILFLHLLLAGITTTSAVQPPVPHKEQLKKWLDSSYEYRYSNPDSSLHYAYKVMEAAKTASYTDVEADALRSLCTTYQSLGEYTKAFTYGKASLQLGRQLNDSLKTAHSLNILGVIYDQQGNFNEALNHYIEAYDIYKAIGNEEWFAMMSVNLGVLFKGIGEYEKVIPYYRDALAIYERINLPVEAAFCETNLGSVFYFTQEFDSCVYYSLKAEKALGEHGYLQIQPTAQCNAGLGYFGLGKLDEAKVYMETALNAHRKYNNKKEIAFVLIQLGKLHQASGQHNLHYQAVSEAKSIAESINSSKELMEATKLLADYHATRQDYRQAFLEFTQYSNLKDTLFQQEKIKEIRNFQIQYETEKKEQQIEILNQQTAIQRLEISKKNLLLFLALAIILIGISITYFMFRQKRLKAEARLQHEINKQQEQATYNILDAEERERRRIAGDLHDGVGQILSAALLNLNYLNKSIQAGEKPDSSIMENALHLVKDSYDEMRSISHQVMPNALLKNGLASSVKDFLDKIDNRIIKVHLAIVGLDKRLNEQTETVLYRAIQESVNNVIKHANATNLSIQIIKEEHEGISVTVEDNGVGFVSTAQEHDEGIGLKNMRSRVALLHGYVELDAAPGRGTVLSIFIPER